MQEAAPAPLDHDALRERLKLSLAASERAAAVAEHRRDEAVRILAETDAAQLVRKADAERLRMAAAGLQTLLDAIAARNLARVEDLVNSALRSVIRDQTITFKIMSEVKRNVNTYRIALIQNGVEGSIDSYGGGVIALCAAVLKIVFNRFAQRYPILALDESLAFLADKYLDDAAEFLRSLSREFDMPVLLVTHKPQYGRLADRIYEASRKDATTTVFRERTSDDLVAA